MRDRVPTYPGRVVLTPVAGQPNTYDMTRADEPTQIGDPLNKANLLQDTVAQMFGLFNTSVPNDVFNFLGKFNLHWWMANGYIAPYYTLGESYEAEVGRDGTAGTYSIQYSDSISVNDSGDVSLDNPTSIEIETDFSGQHADKFNQIPTGFFVTSPDFRNGSTVYQKSGDAYETYVSKVWYTYLPLTSVVGHPAILSGESYVYSTERDAYPDDGNVGETYYKYVGIPYENFTHMPVKIETGSYIGTGTYGNSNKTEITFTFPPKIWGVTAFRDTNKKLHAILNIFPFEPPTDGNNLIFISYSGADSYSRESYYSIDGNTLRIWSLYDAKYQLNNSGCIYYYFGIG